MQNSGEILKDRVDFGAYVLRLDNRSSGQPMRAGITGKDQVDVFRTESRGRPDLSLHIGWNVGDLVGLDVEGQLDRIVAPGDLGHPSDLYTVHLDFTAGLHHQAGAIREQR